MARIMVVDDEMEIIALLDLFLRKKGYDVVTCNGGEKALEEINKNTCFDLAILDRRMPNVDGAAVLSELRKKCGKVPVILLTGSLGTQMKELEVDEFLMKPIDLNELLEKVHKLLGEKA
jgi:DNA-binding response OmpR family regulator